MGGKTLVGIEVKRVIEGFLGLIVCSLGKILYSQKRGYVH